MERFVDPVIVVQARMASSRVPGKSLADVAGEPMLSLVVRRLASSRRARNIVVATSTDALDDQISALAHALGLEVSRGSRDDVLARFVEAVGRCTGPVVRVTGDCPLIDPEILDATVARFLSVRGCAYASNVHPRTYPKGLDIEVVDAEALRTIAREDLDASDREHVTSAIRARPERFAAAAVTSPVDLGDLRWTVDYPDDLEFVRAVAERLGDRLHLAGMREILTAVRRPPSLAGFGGRRRG